MTIAGRRIATQVLHPSLTTFLDLVMHSGELEMWIEEYPIREQSDLAGCTVAESDVRRRTGANVLAVHRHEPDRVVTKSTTDIRLVPGDVLIAVGTRDQLEALEKLASAAG